MDVDERVDEDAIANDTHMKVVVPGDYIGSGYVAGNGTY